MVAKRGIGKQEITQMFKKKSKQTQNTSGGSVSFPCSLFRADCVFISNLFISCKTNSFDDKCNIQQNPWKAELMASTSCWATFHVHSKHVITLASRFWNATWPKKKEGKFIFFRPKNDAFFCDFFQIQNDVIIYLLLSENRV